jgi:hypothetical protein
LRSITSTGRRAEGCVLKTRLFSIRDIYLRQFDVP